MRKLFSCLFVSLLLASSAFGAATSFKRGGAGSNFGNGSRQAPPALRALTDWNILHISGSNFAQKPGTDFSPTTRHIFDGAGDEADTCDEACPNDQISSQESCIDAIKLSTAGITDSDCTTDVGVDSATEFGLLCMCSNYTTRSWNVATNADAAGTGISTRYNLQRAVDGGYYLHEIWADVTDNDWLQAQWVGAAGTVTLAETPGEIIKPSVVSDLGYYFEFYGGFASGTSGADGGQQMDWFIGFANRNATLHDGVGDYLGFRKQDVSDNASEAIYFVAADTGTAAGGNMYEPGTQFAADTGWRMPNTSESAGSVAVHANVVANRAAKEVYADTNTKFAFWVKAIDEVHVYIDDTEVDGSPYDLTGYMADQEIGISMFVKNGDTAEPLDNPAIYYYDIFFASSRYSSTDGVLY